MIGTKIGHYRVLAKIGAGGMGEVYRAHDEQLDRDVALKVLPAANFADEVARARLVREARSAAALNHPHICTIHEVGESDGQMYIAMELIDGQPLSTKLPIQPAQAVRYGTDLADALAHAHARGVIHHDLKSANVMVTSDGRAKILDFGLARRSIAADSDRTDASTSLLTRPGTVLGTLAYMAPEQMQGRRGDTRSDIWALGVVLYELVAGVPPFRRSGAVEMISAVLSEPLPPLPSHVPAPLRGVIERCLEKDPGHRYQRAEEVGAALQAIESGVSLPARFGRGWALTAGIAALVILALSFAAWSRWTRRDPMPAPRIGSLAVLPLQNASGDPKQEYLADGTTGEIINALAKIRALKVISRTSAMQYKNTKKRVPDIARELGVDGIIEGSVQRVAGRVKVSVQLVRAATDTTVWAQSYERESEDVLGLLSQVARTIADEVRVTLTPAERADLMADSRVDPAAYEAYLQGREQCTLWTHEGIVNGTKLLTKSLSVDPTFAPAHAELSACYALAGFFGLEPTRSAFPKAKAAAEQALKLDIRLAEGHVVMHVIKRQYDWDWVGAEAAIKRALELNPNSASAHQRYGEYLTIFGRIDDAVAEFELARQLDPATSTTVLEVAFPLFMARRYKEALPHVQSALRLAPADAAGYAHLASCYALLGRRAEALQSLAKALEDTPLHVDISFDVQVFQAHVGLGDLERARSLASYWMKRARTGPVEPFWIAFMNVLIGNHETAIQWLQRAYAERSPALVYLNADRDWDPIRSDPRFEEIVRRMGLPPNQPSAAAREAT